MFTKCRTLNQRVASLAVALQTALDEAAAEELLNFEVSYDFDDILSTSKLIDRFRGDCECILRAGC